MLKKIPHQGEFRCQLRRCFLSTSKQRTFATSRAAAAARRQACSARENSTRYMAGSRNSIPTPRPRLLPVSASTQTGWPQTAPRAPGKPCGVSPGTRRSHPPCAIPPSLHPPAIVPRASTQSATCRARCCRSAFETVCSATQPAGRIPLAPSTPSWSRNTCHRGSGHPAAALTPASPAPASRTRTTKPRADPHSAPAETLPLDSTSGPTTAGTCTSS